MKERTSVIVTWIGVGLALSGFALMMLGLFPVGFAAGVVGVITTLIGDIILRPC